MDWNSIHPDERIRLWKDFRNSLKSLTIEEQLQHIANFFINLPLGNRTIDFYTLETWSTPWEILYQGKWCINSSSLLMFYTLDLLPSFKDINLEIILIDDKKDRYLLPRIDDQFVLNYILGQVSKIQDIKDECRIIDVYTRQQLKKIK